MYRVVAPDATSPTGEQAILATIVAAGREAMRAVTLAGMAIGAEITCERTELSSDPWVLERKGERVELSRREKEIASAIVAGLRRGEIAEQCDIQASTFDTHRLNVMRLMGCANEVQLTRLAIAKGWVQL